MPDRREASTEKPGHAALRRGRRSHPGQVYLITVATSDRRPYFLDPAVARTVASALSTAYLWRDGRLLAWVLMPDHWHGLIELGTLDSISTSVGRMKAITARAARASSATKEKIWTTAFHDRALRRDEDVVVAARYVVANPLRAGLVERIGDYPYWDAVWLNASNHGDQSLL
jgi:putative transposase